MLGPKRHSQSDGTLRVGSIAAHTSAQPRSGEDADDQHPLPIDLGCLAVLRLGLQVGFGKLGRGDFFREPRGVFEGCRDAYRLVRSCEGKPAEHTNPDTDEVGRPGLLLKQAHHDQLSSRSRLT